MMVLAFRWCCFDTGSVLLRCCPQMLRSEDPGVHYEAVGVLGNLVHSSQEIKQQVLQVRGAGGRKAWRARQPPAACWWAGARKQGNKHPGATPRMQLAARTSCIKSSC